ncbi:MAG: phenylalanine--tRNA ligase subunit beta [candidate division Zixibacteria bacterium]|nr:phenylalanine--tRNA ligase subunit beta [candidate division Zixibacteria bacterium]
MQVPYSWIKELVDVDWEPQALADRLTIAGEETEIEEPFAGQFEHILVGHVAELEKIENSDHLKKAMVDTGNGLVPVVCGAPNVAPGQKVVFAEVGAVLHGGMEIKPVKLRGVQSQGMICSERELGLTDDHSGIIVLDPDAPVGTPILAYLGLKDHIIKLDLTPNRSDLLSVFGVARDIACLCGKKVRRPVYKLTESKEKAAELATVSIDDPDACPRYAARMIKNIKIGPSPWWIKKKLIMSGMRPISNVVDITNLVMLETGHPLHAFDFDKLERKEILVRRAKDGELFTTLDGVEHRLTPEVLMITDGNKGIAAAGVMGGLDSEVTDATTTVLLEAAYFNPVTIRRGRLHLGMTSESSVRFEKGADPNMVPNAADRAAFLLQKYAGGEVLKGLIDCYPKKIKPLKVQFRPERANAILGTKLTPKRMHTILKGLDFGLTETKTPKVEVPTFRPDVTREIDLIEEIARIEGLDNIPTSDRNIGPLLTKAREDDLFRDRVRATLTAQGYDEIYGVGLADAPLMKLLTGDQPQLEILNPIAEDLAIMQNDIIYALMKAVGHNLAHRNLNLRLFEVGKAFSPENEFMQIGLAVTGKTDDHWYDKGREFEFYDVKGAIDALCASSRIPELTYATEAHLPFVPECSFTLKLGDHKVGRAGRMHDKTAKRFDIKQPVFIAVLDFAAMFAVRVPLEAYKPLPRFPAAPRDLAVIVDETVRVGDMLDTIRELGGTWLEQLDVFDLYRGKQIGENKKSLAFAMVYRSAERSLENEEVNGVQEKIADELKKRFNAEIREG